MTIRSQAPFPRRAEARLPDPEHRLQHSLEETRRAFEESRIDDGIRGLGHAIVVASTGDHALSDVELLQLVNSVTTIGARQVANW